MPMELVGGLFSSIVRAEFSKNMPQGQVEKSTQAFVSALRLKVLASERARTKRLQTDDSAKGILLHRADVSRGSSTERGDASTASSTEPARATDALARQRCFDLPMKKNC